MMNGIRQLFYFCGQMKAMLLFSPQILTPYSLKLRQLHILALNVIGIECICVEKEANSSQNISCPSDYNILYLIIEIKAQG